MFQKDAYKSFYKSVEEIYNSLRPCINVVHGEAYINVLREIINAWREGREESSSYYYSLYKRGFIDTRDTRVLDVLRECGYIVCRDGEDTLRGKKKVYYPTPLGIALEKILAIYSLFDEILKNEHIKQQIFETDIYDGVIEEIINDVIDIPSSTCKLTLLLFPHTSKSPHLTKGLNTLRYCVFLVLLKEDMIYYNPGESSKHYQELNCKEWEEELNELLQNIQFDQRIAKSRLENNVVCKGGSEYGEDAFCKMLNHIIDMYNLFIRMSEVHRKINLHHILHHV